ncbi:hypothetical protein EVAR_63366_1 [Eumeta japonica]|uniref:Uncharacterized protein n=1 Tax=Eumeta variegata TaxID=151549 RepID=A0A4C2A1D3_EUMVA|nr:hypothetical protein EVAR_63366_1 [Eumeta japonica]
MKNEQHRNQPQRRNSLARLPSAAVRASFIGGLRKRGKIKCPWYRLISRAGASEAGPASGRSRRGAVYGFDSDLVVCQVRVVPHTVPLGMPGCGHRSVTKVVRCLRHTFNQRGARTNVDCRRSGLSVWVIKPKNIIIDISKASRVQLSLKG